MKILELTIFSAGGCGVWMRCKQESVLLAKRGHEVLVLSSNIEKGSNKIVSHEDYLGQGEGQVKILRYPATKLGGESFMSWFKGESLKKALEFNPDIVIAHNYRHLHTTKSLKLIKILRKQGNFPKVFLTTHSPFVEGNITRTKLQTAIVWFYDRIIGPLTLNKFDKILAISNWEIPYLLKAGAKKENIVYSPNGIPEEFFTLPPQVEAENKILFLGRIAPKKRIETLIACIPYLKENNWQIEVVGPQEEEYFKELKKLEGFNKILFSPAIYDLKEKIAKIDSCKIFVLPSRVEGQPQALIEAMTRKKTVVGSDSIAIRDIIREGENGYLFEFNNPQSLAKKIDNAIEHPIDGSKSVSKFNWNILISKMEKLFK